MLPLLLAGAAALLVLGGGSKRRAPRRNGDSGSRADSGAGSGAGTGTGTGPVVAGGLTMRAPSSSRTIGVPWSHCKPPPGSPKFTAAAVSEDGKSCMVFWKPETREVVRVYIRAELAKLPKSKQDALCATDNCEPDPFAMDPLAFCEWIPDADREAFVKRVALQLFPQIDQSSLPPSESSEYFIKYVWSRVYDTFASDFCGFNPVT